MILLYIVQAKAPGKLRVTCTKENQRCCESVIYTSANPVLQIYCLVFSTPSNSSLKSDTLVN